MNIVPRSVSYCTRTLAQYDILLGTIFTNIHAITLYYNFLHCRCDIFKPNDVLLITVICLSIFIIILRSCLILTVVNKVKE